MSSEVSIPAILSKFSRDNNIASVLVVNDLLSLLIASKLEIQDIRKKYLNNYAEIIANVIELNDHVLVILQLHERYISEIIFILNKLDRILSENEASMKVLVLAIADSRRTYERFLKFGIGGLNIVLPPNIQSLYSLLEFAINNEEALQIFLVPSIWVNMVITGIDIDTISYGAGAENKYLRLGVGDVLLISWGYYYDIALQAFSQADLSRDITLVGVLKVNKGIDFSDIDEFLVNYKVIVVFASDTLLGIIRDRVLNLIDKLDTEWIPTIIFWGEEGSNKVITSSGVLSLIRDLLGFEGIRKDSLMNQTIVDEFFINPGSGLLATIKDFKNKVLYEKVSVVKPLTSLDASIVIMESLMDALTMNKSIVVTHLSSIIRNLIELRLLLTSQTSFVLIILTDQLPKKIVAEGESLLKDLSRNKGIFLRANRESLVMLARKVEGRNKAIIILE